MNTPPALRSARLENVFFGDGYYDMCLRIGELIQLQEKTGVGPMVLSARLVDGTWMVGDIIETLRLALIGGGMDNRQAFDLVKQTVIEGHLDYYNLAGDVLFASLFGAPEDMPEIKETEEDPLETSIATDSSVGVHSSSPQELWDSPQET